MNMTEVGNSPVVEGLLVNRAESFGLSAQYINELPLPAKQLMNRLGKLGNAVFKEKRISMLDETLMSAAMIEKNPKLIKDALGCNDEAELAGVQRDLIRGSLLSDLGKVANEQLIWMYNGLNFNTQKVQERLGKFLEKRPEVDQNTQLMQLPYSVAMDFYRDITYNGSEAGSNTWDQSRRDCDKYLRELGFNVNTGKENEFGDRECTLHDVMSGAHLAVLPEVLKKCGIDNDPDWERAIFVAKNHHLSRGLVGGLPLLLKDQKFLETIWSNKNVDQNQWTRMALLEEIFDMSFAAAFRAPRHGDTHGVNARTRMIKNLRRSEDEDRINRAERGYVTLLLRGMGEGNIFSDTVVDFVEDLKV